MQVLEASQTRITGKASKAYKKQEEEKKATEAFKVSKGTIALSEDMQCYFQRVNFTPVLE